jgi:hypothetical protein
MYNRERHDMQQGRTLWNHIRNKRMTLGNAIQMLTISRERRDAVLLMWRSRRAAQR